MDKMKNGALTKDCGISADSSMTIMGILLLGKIRENINSSLEIMAMPQTA